MNLNWSKIFSTVSEAEAAFVQGLLYENEIESNILNKKDSAYGTFGEIEIYVNRDNVIKAIKILDERDD